MTYKLPSSMHEPTLNEDTNSAAGKVVPIGRKVQGVLDQLEQTPAWLAERVGVSRSTITRILKGERNPTPETLQELAPVLGLTVAQLASGTDAAERVKDAKNLVARKDYEGAVRQVIEYERSVRDLAGQVRDLKAELERQRESIRRAHDDAERAGDRVQDVQTQRDEAIRKAAQHEADARRYQQALEKAVTDVARLTTEVRELGTAMDAGRQTARIGAILAGVAAAVSVATYLNADAAGASDSKAAPPRPSKPPNRRGARA